MDKNFLLELIDKVNKGLASDEELAQYNAYLNRLAPGHEKWPEHDLESPEVIRMELWQRIEAERASNAPRTIRMWPRIAAAASIILLLSAGALFLMRKNRPDSPQVTQHFDDIKPGTNAATLTLGNGQTIILNEQLNGRLAVQGNVSVNKVADGQVKYTSIAGAGDTVMENTITTRRKEQYKVVLSDGTGVWLNAASSIKYPTIFTGSDREVTITGEAYFEVAHNEAKPFKVLANGQTVEVLGTHFNINAYTDEPAVKTTLLEGAVKVSNDKSARIIKPGQQAVLQNNKLSVVNANTEEAIAWKEGYFRFDGEKIESIMRKLARWYDIDVQYGEAMPDDEFTGVSSRSRNISEVLKKLEYYKTVHFKMEGRKVTVSK